MNVHSNYSAWLGNFYANCTIDRFGTVYANYPINPPLRDEDLDMDTSDEWLDCYDALCEWVSKLTDIPFRYVDQQQQESCDPCLSFELTDAYQWVYEKDMEEWR